MKKSFLQYFSKDLFLLTFIWWILVLIVNPIGDFPLNDDWSYAINAKELSENNRIYFHDWGAMTIIAHTIWGGLFCKLFGFSFTALRFSTLILGWIGTLFTYLFFKEAKLKKRIAFWVTLLVMFNPMFFCLAYSYMTEVPFYCFLILGAHFFQKNINQGGTKNLVFATLFSIVAVLIRQHGVLMPLAFLFIHIIKNKTSLKTVIQAIAPLFATYETMHFFIQWRESNFGLSKTFRTFDDLVAMIESGRIWFIIKYDLHGIFNYWGLFLLPILIILIPFFWKKLNRATQLSSIITTLLLSYPYFEKWNHGFHGNVFYNFGLGPRAGLDYPHAHHPVLADEVWTGIILTAFIGGILLLKWLLIRSAQTLVSFFNQRSKEVNWARAFSLTAAFGYFLFLLTSEWMFSRYYLMAIPFIVIILLSNVEIMNISKFWKISALTIFSLITLFSIGATKDYLSWNRARMNATKYLLDEKIIDVQNFRGGFEWSGWLNIPKQGGIPFESYQWWNSDIEANRLSFGKVCGYEQNTEKLFHITRVLPPGRDTIFISQKQIAFQLDEIKCNMDSITQDSQHFVTTYENLLIGKTSIRNQIKSHSGKYSVRLDAKHHYALTFKIPNIEPCDKLWVDIWRYPARNNVSMVLSAPDPKNYYQSEGNLITELEESGWGQLSQNFTIPYNFQDSVVTFYIFNPSGEEVWVDDLTIRRMKF